MTCNLPRFHITRGTCLLFAESYEGAEPDHSEAGGYSLIAAETRTGSQSNAERGSKGDDKEVGSGVQRDGHGA